MVSVQTQALRRRRHWPTAALQPTKPGTISYSMSTKTSNIQTFKRRLKTSFCRSFSRPTGTPYLAD